MQGKVMIFFLLGGLAAGFFYLRSMGPRCGDQRCDKGALCFVNEAGSVTGFSCEPLDPSCGLWPSCSCVSYPDSYDCDDDVFGYIRVTAPPI